MIEVRGPDGNTYNFPDGTPQDVMRDAMRRRFGGPEASAPLDLRPRAGESRDDYRARVAAGREQSLATPLAPDIQAAQAQFETDFAPQQERDPGLAGLVMPLRQGMTFGFGDEISSRIASLSPNVTYEEALASDRDLLARVREDRPIASTVAEIAGALPTAIATAPAVAGRSFLGLMGRGAGTGAAMGAAYGFGEGEGGFGPRAANAGLMGAAGGVLGGAIPAVASAVAPVVRAAGGVLRGAIGVPSRDAAGRVLAGAMNRAGVDETGLAQSLDAAAADGQGMFTVADALGDEGRRALSVVARTPSPGRREIAELLAARQRNQGDRLGDFTREALGLGDETAVELRALQAARRSTDAGANYAAADAAATPVDLSRSLAFIDDALGAADQGLRNTTLGQRFAHYRAMMQVPENRLPPGVTGMSLSDYPTILAIKQQLGDEIRAARQSAPALATRLQPLLTSLDEALEAASLGYRRANDTYARQSRVLDAVDQGADVARAPMQARDAVNTYTRLPVDDMALPVPAGTPIPGQRDAFRIGFGNQMLTRPDNITPGTNALTRFDTEKTRQMMQEMATDPDLWARRFQRESIMFETGKRALGNSQTFDNFAEAGDMAGQVGIIANLLQGRPMAAAGQAAGRVLNSGAGLDDQTATMIARALISRDPGLAGLVQRGNMRAAQARAVENLTTFGGISALDG